ncbi:MAG: LemA family protein [Planctomycetes bacterium]|nr:LemA family protein [Planctomycetota bacterium]
MSALQILLIAAGIALVGAFGYLAWLAEKKRREALAARRFYNANIREMSRLCRTVPTNLIARAFGFEGGEYFELGSEAERVVPRVDLSRTSDR